MKIENMKVEIDAKSGFCFGVVNAIKKAEEELSKGGDSKIYGKRATGNCSGKEPYNMKELIVDFLTKKVGQSPAQ